MKKIIAAVLVTVALSGCSVTAQQGAEFASIAAVTGAAIAGVVKPAIAIPAGTIAGAIAGGATAGAAVFTTPASK